MKIVTEINTLVNEIVWGLPAMICIVGAGIYLTIGTGFIQIRKFPYAIAQIFGRLFDRQKAGKGAISPFQAVCTALAGTIGTGSIAGVAGVIAIGGPGAVFWMCRQCGHLHFDINAPEVCPTCGFPKAYFERQATNY